MKLIKNGIVASINTAYIMKSQVKAQCAFYCTFGIQSTSVKDEKRALKNIEHFVSFTSSPSAKK